VPSAPLDRLLVQTDAPLLTAVPHRETLNEQSRVSVAGAAITQVEVVETPVLAEVSTRNARALFAL